MVKDGKTQSEIAEWIHENAIKNGLTFNSTTRYTNQLMFGSDSDTFVFATRK